MNYLIMKSIVDSIISHFQCRECAGKITEKDVSVIDSGAQGVNLEVCCPKCRDVTSVKAEINVIKTQSDLERLDNSDIEIARILNLGNVQSDAAHQTEVAGPSIRDEDITTLRNRLKQAGSVEDIFKA